MKHLNKFKNFVTNLYKVRKMEHSEYNKTVTVPSYFVSHTLSVYDYLSV